MSEALIALLAAIAFLVVPSILLGIMVRRSPEGWEDETGFHLGRKP